jgi:ribosomal protein S18 acetylase RimI-like enzyme
MDRDFAIRELGAGDLTACARVIRLSFATVAEAFGLTPQNCPNHPAFIRKERLIAMREAGARFFGLYAADTLAGCVAARVKGAIAYIEKLAVLPQYRHMGYGNALMDAALGYAKEQGCGKASIGIIDENTVLKDWYKSMGFTVVEIKEFAHLPFTVCIMTKSGCR